MSKYNPEGYSVRVALPLQLNDGTPVADSTLAAIVRRFVSIAGGVTVHPAAQGHWRSDYTGKTYVEPVQIVEVAAQHADTVERLEALAQEIADELQQECIFFVVQRACVRYVGA